MAASCVVRGKRSDRRVSPFRRSGGIIAQMFWFHKTKLEIGQGFNILLGRKGALHFQEVQRT